MKDSTILAIETSCDETSGAIVKNGRTVLSNVISSQIPIHKIFGGVVPEVASRKHLEAIQHIVSQALEEAGCSFDDIDAVAVTKGPGLVGALLVGISAGKAIAYAKQIPLIGVNHMHGHIAANYISHPELEPPFTSLVVSGGHSYLIQAKDYTTFEIIGQTRDDACGEAFDKVARSLGLPYPGGPQIDKYAKEGNSEAIDFPRVMLEKDSYDFSFSGLKTAVLNYLNQQKQQNKEISIPDVCASFQAAVMDVLVEKTLRYIDEIDSPILVLSGGVAANSKLRERLGSEMKKRGKTFYYPENILCTDNAAMIASAGYYAYQAGVEDDLDLQVYPNLGL